MGDYGCGQNYVGYPNSHVYCYFTFSLSYMLSMSIQYSILILYCTMYSHSITGPVVLGASPLSLSTSSQYSLYSHTLSSVCLFLIYTLKPVLTHSLCTVSAEKNRLLVLHLISTSAFASPYSRSRFLCYSLFSLSIRDIFIII